MPVFLLNAVIETIKYIISGGRKSMQKIHVKANRHWMNDPNGFIYYKGKYHLFYQCFPYEARWGRMHWAHVVSDDLVNWEYQGIAVFPSKTDDRDGCFSGSAVEDEGKLYLYYTGVRYLVENPEDINLFLDEQFVSAQMLITSEDGYHFDPETTVGIYFGELQQPYESERVKAVDDIFENTGLHWIITDDIQAEIWGKFKLNVCNNLPQAILGVGVGCYEDSEHMAAIRDGLRAEVEAVAKAKGIDLSMINAKSGRGSAVKASARYSTLQDIDSGRHTEIDMFSGAMMRMGKELGIPTPYNEYTYHMIKALEEKNDGVFEFQGENDRVSWSK